MRTQPQRPTAGRPHVAAFHALTGLLGRRLEAGRASRHSPHDLLGVGIDMAERGTYAAVPVAWIHRAASRWLTPDERQWCTTQSSFREAMTVVLCSKEAAWKACNAPANAWNVALTMIGDVETGGVATATQTEMRVEVDWLVSAGMIVALATARGPT